MRELWWLIRGSVRLRLTGADPERSLRLLSRSMRLENVVRNSVLEVEFTVSAGDLKRVYSVARRCGDRAELLERRGVPRTVEKWMHCPVICFTVLLLIMTSLWLPGRVLFVRVEGNEAVPVRRILEEASACGLHFGAARSWVRSEQVKNRLLEAIPELSWVGVNTSGCVASVAVRERQRSREPETDTPGNIVAAVDGLVTSVTATAGTPLCAADDAVRAGQTLISGYTDLGLCTHVEAAQGEVFALTERRISAVLPRMTRIPLETASTVKIYSLLLGQWNFAYRLW